MNQYVRSIAANAVIAALYVAFTLASYPLSFDQIQFRISEILILLCFFRKDFIFGLTIGCAIANCFSTLGPIDIAFGTAATFLACLGITFSRHLIVAIFFPVITNAFLVAWELQIALGLPYWVSVGWVALGEFTVMAVGYAIFMIFRRNTRFHNLIKSTQNTDFKF